MKKQTQGRQLIALLKRRAYTTMEMLRTGISTCPWKRIDESLAHNEELVTGRKWLGGQKYINTYRVKRATNSKC